MPREDLDPQNWLFHLGRGATAALPLHRELRDDDVAPHAVVVGLRVVARNEARAGLALARHAHDPFDVGVLVDHEVDPDDGSSRRRARGVPVFVLRNRLQWRFGFRFRSDQKGLQRPPVV